MKKILVVFFTLTLSLSTMAQKLEIGIGYGYSQITAPEQYVKSVSNLGYGFTKAYPILAAIRFSRPDNPLSFSLSTVYQKLTGRGAIVVFYSGNSNLFPGQMENEFSLWSIALGADWTIVKSTRAPHLLLEFLFSSMSDLSTITGTPEGDLHQMKSGSIQNGVAFGGGFNFPLGFGTEVRLDARYILYGLFGRPTGEKSVNSVQLTGLFTFPIWSSQTE